MTEKRTAEEWEAYCADQALSSYYKGIEDTHENISRAMSDIYRDQPVFRAAVQLAVACGTAWGGREMWKKQY
jgi:hypothetical protein